MFQTGGFPDLDLSVLFCPFWDFPDFSGIFPICSGMVRGFSRFVLFLFLGLLRAPTRNSPERLRDTIWTFPEKSGKHPGLEPPRFSFCQASRCGNSCDSGPADILEIVWFAIRDSVPLRSCTSRKFRADQNGLIVSLLVIVPH